MRDMRSNFYNPGVKGGATGAHIHIAVFHGKPQSAYSGCGIFTFLRHKGLICGLVQTEKIKNRAVSKILETTRFLMVDTNGLEPLTSRV